MPSADSIAATACPNRAKPVLGISLRCRHRRVCRLYGRVSLMARGLSQAHGNLVLRGP